MEKYVVGFGDNVVDYYLNRNMKYPGGNAVNFCVNAVKSGVKAYYVGSVVNDDDGNLVFNSLQDVGVNTRYTERFDGPNPTENTRVDISDGDRVFVDYQRGDRRTPLLTLDLIKMMENSALVHSGCHANVENKLTTLKKAGVRISFDFDSMDKYHTDEYLTEVCPSIYLALFSVAGQAESEINRLIARCKAFGVAYALFTRGSEKPFFVDLQSDCRYSGFNLLVERPKDTMGAGDAYFAAFASTFVTRKSAPLLERIEASFQNAAKQSAQIIMADGSYGYGHQI